MDFNLENFLGMYIFLAWATIHALELNTFCTPNPNTDPHLPSLNQSSFRAEIAGKIVEKRMSVYVIQTVSLQDKKSSLFWIAANTSKFIIVNSATNKTIAGDTESCCLLTQDDPVEMLFLSLLQALDDDMKYIGDAEVKGIHTSHWQKCSSLSTGANFTLDIYLTENEDNWNMSFVHLFVPVRVELTGQMWENGVIVPLHHVYDYLQFEHFDGDKYSTAFEPPPGVLCPGLKQEVLIPDMPTSLSFSRETTVSGQNYIDLETVFYNSVDKVSRSDYFDGAREIHLIRDFNEGVIYKIDVIADTCEVLPMTPFAEQENGSSTELNWQYVLDANGYIQMQSVKDYFLLSGNFTFEGEHLVRGVPCDLYSHKVTNYKGYQGWTLIGLYFSKANIQMYNTRGSVVVGDNQLVRVTVENEKITTASEIYNVDPEPMPDKNPYDVSMCFNASSQMPFIISFDVEGISQLEPQDTYRFTKLAVHQIALVANVSSFRVHWDEVTMDNDLISFQGKILDVPAAYVRYMKIAGKKQDSTVLPSPLKAIIHTQVGLSASACATYCSKETSLGPLPKAVDFMPTCGSFDFCKNSGSCYFYPRYTDSEFRRFVEDTDCDHFQKTTSNENPTPLVDAWSSLREAVNREQLEVMLMKPNDSSSMTVFSGEGITNLNPASENLGESLHDYDEIPGVQLYNPVVQKDSVTLDDCARLCSGNLSFQCQSFVYCKKRLACSLHNFPFAERMGYVKTLSCSTYSRSYVKDFEQVPDTSILSGSGTTIQNIYDKEQCAFMCLNSTDFLCESFEFCELSGQGVCYLGDIHLYDLPRDDVQRDPNCDHYSRNYETDFDEISNKVTNYAVDHTISGVTVAQCAWICSTQTTNDCSIFQFCEDQKQCQLISSAARNASLVLVDSDSCHIFTKKKVSETKREGQLKSYNSGYSKGAMAGVGLGMTVLGVGLALVGLFIFVRVQRHLATSNSAMSAQLTMDEITD